MHLKRVFRITTWAAVALTACSSDSSTSPKSSLPPRVIPNLVFTSLSSGFQYSCGVTAGESVYCWGGQPGNTSHPDTTPRLFPDTVTLRSLSTGSNNACLLSTSGAAYCWGDNSNGELGNGGYVSSPVPVPVLGGLQFDMLSSGGSHTCGVASTGAAYCWGWDFYGELGDSSGRYDAPYPISVAGNLAFSSVSAGTVHTCGITTAGAAYCWGDNELGRLGNNTTVSSSFPVPVAGGLTFTAVTAGNQFTCGLTPSGAVYCWGRRLGDIRDTPSIDSIPRLVPDGRKFATISAGNVHVCGISDSATAYCWGVNDLAVLGSGSVEPESLPIPVIGGRHYKLIASGLTHTCGVAVGDTTFCWGEGLPLTNATPLSIAGPR